MSRHKCSVPLLHLIYILPTENILLRYGNAGHGFADNTHLHCRFDPRNPCSLIVCPLRMTEACLNDLNERKLLNKLMLNP